MEVLNAFFATSAPMSFAFSGRDLSVENEEDHPQPFEPAETLYRPESDESAFLLWCKDPNSLGNHNLGVNSNDHEAKFRTVFGMMGDHFKLSRLRGHVWREWLWARPPQVLCT
ncbi:hypothetical protein PHYSODRAFT_321469 [Phytophthora sojae]|uniref:Uncharacterized protein n=1 Tax=Phytophthora sojae (strain P6497) TaxID=1094619 RepID=G4YH21_PHYSP|nr:hypothetical protein PHYSODRAFT_321469 [Phytophthora sojae]EGZ27722.1 hypothetical protein PHYSODRAFT_321469 [Phytophthora sojae]|eukprot:XP_009514997.1 hypothetical protein PHYSODRAFT_321469 [Phytophthora sojae]